MPRRHSPRVKVLARLLLLVISLGCGFALASLLWPLGAKRLLALIRIEQVPSSPPISVILRGECRFVESLNTGFSAGARIRSYFPDNPRHYFLEAFENYRAADVLFRTSRLISVGEPLGEREIRFEQASAFNRVVLTGCDPEQPWRAMLEYPAFDLAKGDTCRVRFRARSSGPKKIEAVLLGPPEEKPDMPPHLEFELSSEWRDYDGEFAAAPVTTQARLLFNLAADALPVDVAEPQVAIAGREYYAPLPASDEPSYFVEYEMNNLGFRDDDFQVEKLPSVWRIALIGDSFTFGTGVHAIDLFANQLETRLNNRTKPLDHPRDFDVLNFGIAGFGTEDEREQHEGLVAEFAPDVVLLTMCYNDNVTFAEGSRIGREYPDADDNHREQIRYIGQRGYGDCARELERLHDSCVAHGARLAVFVFAVEDTPAWRDMYQTVAEALRPRGVPVMTLFDVLRRYDLLGKVAVHATDGHPNEVAHRIAAGELEKFLAENNLLGESQAAARAAATVPSR